MAADFQAPPLLMTETEIGAAVTVYARSLAWLRGRFPGVPITVVYVPSAPSVYRHGGATVMLKQVFAPSDPGGPTYKYGLPVSPAAIYARSELACTKIRDATPEGVAFIDARPAFRKGGGERLHPRAARLESSERARLSYARRAGGREDRPAHARRVRAGRERMTDPAARRASGRWWARLWWRGKVIDVRHRSCADCDRDGPKRLREERWKEASRSGPPNRASSATLARGRMIPRSSSTSAPTAATGPRRCWRAGPTRSSTVRDVPAEPARRPRRGLLDRACLRSPSRCR